MGPMGRPEYMREASLPHLERRTVHLRPGPHKFIVDIARRQRVPRWVALEHAVALLEKASKRRGFEIPSLTHGNRVCSHLRPATHDTLVEIAAGCKVPGWCALELAVELLEEASKRQRFRIPLPAA